MPQPIHDYWVQGNDAGPYRSPLDKYLIHTTDGSSIEGAIGAYRKNNSWPHITVDAIFGHPYRRCGHLDMGRAARALKNLPGGVETNTDGVLQVEVVGFATRPNEIDWAWIGKNVIGPMCRDMNVPIQSSVIWLPYPDSYGKTNVRLTGHEWTVYQGILGHQHAPENSHGDPGAIPIGTVLTAAGANPGPTPNPTPTLEDLMPFTVVAAPTDAANRPWRALLPGKLVTFVDWNPVPAETPIEQFVPGWAYYEGGAAGLFLPAKRAKTNQQYDEWCAVAQQMLRLPANAVAL